MQNRYVGDVGDFGKYGLLRWLCGMTGPALREEERLRLGVVWYLNSPEDNRDGDRIDFLNNTPVNCRRFRKCDPELYEKLRDIVENKNRFVAATREKRILPWDSIYFNTKVHNNHARELARDNWLNDAIYITSAADIVFLDPDNGIASKEKEKRVSYSPKHVYMKELIPFIERGQSLVIYHHAARVSSEMQILYLTLRLQVELGLTWVRILSYHPSSGGGGIRFYFIVVQPKHKDVIDERLNGFRQSPWCAGADPNFTLLPGAF